MNISDLKKINEDDTVNKRLLKSFSVNSLKEIFQLEDVKKIQSHLIEEIINKFEEKKIYDKIFSNFSLLKQHSYIFEIKGVWDEKWLLDNPNFVSFTSNGKILFYNFVFKKQTEFYNFGQSFEGNIVFKIPVQIIKYKKFLIFSFNIVEKDTKAIIGEGNSFKLDFNSEKKLLYNWLNDNSKAFNLIKVDLNKGIKYLWANDIIDSFNVKFKKDKSVSSELMDDQYLVKQNYPELYKNLSSNSLKQVVFKYLLPDELINNFVVNPEEGNFLFSIFPKQFQGVNDLIFKVLDNN